MTLEFDGRVEGKDLDILVSAVADTPLINRPPVADAGADIAVSEHQRAFVQPTLDALDSRLASLSKREDRQAIESYKQRLIERAQGIDTHSQDGK